MEIDCQDFFFEEKSHKMALLQAAVKSTETSLFLLNKKYFPVSIENIVIMMSVKYFTVEIIF